MKKTKNYKKDNKIRLYIQIIKIMNKLLNIKYILIDN